MATRRQPLIPGWLIPGVSAATLVVAVALAAFLALWWNAPQGDWSGSLAGQLPVACGALLLLAGVSLWRYSLLYPRYSSPARSIAGAFRVGWRCCVCAQ